MIAAHPDDEILGCGATMAKHVEAGDDVSVMFLGEGREDHETISTYNARKASNCIGSQVYKILAFPDNKFDSIPLLEIIQAIEKAINSIKPEIIYTHWNKDLNVDHRIVHQAVLTATRPMEGMPVKTIYAFAIPSSAEWNFNDSFRPNVFVDVKDTFPKKLEAMKAYASECRPFPHPRSEKALTIGAQYWGSVVGLEYVELFELVREISYEVV